MTNTVKKYQGMISVDFLAKEHNLTVRTLERTFKKETGITPKAFINITRFINASKEVKKNLTGESLLAIAYKTGYFDHAHLTRDFRKFSGLNPSELGLVRTFL